MNHKTSTEVISGLNRTSVGLKPRYGVGVRAFIAAGLNRTSVGLKPRNLIMGRWSRNQPQSNQRGIETLQRDTCREMNRSGLNRTSVGLKLHWTSWHMLRDQRLNRTSVGLKQKDERAIGRPSAGLNRTSVGLKRIRFPISSPSSGSASIEPAWD